MKNLRPRQPKMEAAGDLTPPAELHEEDDLEHSPKTRSKSKSKASAKRKAKAAEEKAQSTPKKTRRTVIDPECRFVGDPIPDDEARKRWPERYEDSKSNKASSTYASSKRDDEEEEVLFAHCHYMEAEIEGCIYCLNDDVYVKGVEGEPNYIGKIVELFETNDNRLFFQAQWFYRAKDTVIQDHASLIDKKRVFLSDVKNNNPLDCVVSKLNIIQIDPNANEAKIPPCDFYFNMTYSEAYSEFANILPESARLGCDTNSTISTDAGSESGDSNPKVARRSMSLLDLYSGCGAMSTGLCLGASTADLNLVTRWAVDLNEFACESLKCNHPETEVRNESADDFLILLKEWQKLCKKFALLGTKNSETISSSTSMKHHEEKENESKVSSGEYEVEKLVGICYGDPKDIKKPGIYFKVRWKGYNSDEDTWEPITGLSKCQEKIQEFVTWGYKSNILPLPGDADVICGGPPCQGISGFNRFRNRVAPLDDPKNHQLVVFMDIVEYLKPKFVLMENVVDILKLAKGFLGRYAVGRLVSMNYQSRLGMMVAGCYGLPQFRMRVFLWGALPTEKLPQYPLPTHDVVVRGGFPNEFERNVVAYDEDQICQREQALLLADAISDLPPITNEEIRDEMPYNEAAQTDFQKYIRSSKDELMNTKTHAKSSSRKAVLFDHRPLQLNDDDYQRVCQIPKKKGANFRDLPGVVVRSDNKVEWDESMERVYLPSGKPLVPDYAMSFRGGTSTKPFSRLWWDEIVPTVVTRAEPHNQAILHPEQDRVLSIRENARLQGFPDYYKLVGPVKQRYTQVGNAVAIPVSRALGYALSLAAQGDCSNEPLITLPARFSSFVPTPNETDVVDCSM